MDVELQVHLQLALGAGPRIPDTKSDLYTANEARVGLRAVH